MSMLLDSAAKVVAILVAQRLRLTRVNSNSARNCISKFQFRLISKRLLASIPAAFFVIVNLTWKI
jgi:hypothetical protein